MVLLRLLGVCLVCWLCVGSAVQGQVLLSPISGVGSSGGSVLDIGGEVYNVRAYGATGNGTTDDAPFIQAAITAVLATPTRSGVVYVPRGSYKINSLLDFSANQIISISLIGEALDATELVWGGATTGTAVKMGRNRGMRIENIRIRNSVAAGTTTGLLLAGDVAGTNNSIGRLSLVRVDGFSECLVVGDTGTHAVSEISYYNISLNTCGIGVRLNDQQTVNHWFYGLGMAANTTGMLVDTNSGGSLSVHGGSASTNTEDFAIRGGSGSSFYNFRSENAGRFMTVGTDAGADGPTAAIVNILNCTINNTINADNRAIRLNRGGKYVIEGNLITDGTIYLNTGVNARSTLSLRNNAMPSGLFENGDVASALTLIEQIGNSASAAVHYDDKIYYLRDTATTRDFLKLSVSTNVGSTPVYIQDLALGNLDAATAVAQTVTTMGATGTDKSGATLSVVGSLGTGNGTAGRVHLKAGAKSATTGSTAQATVDRLVTGCTKVLADNVATSVVSATVAAGTAIGGMIRYTIEVTDGTDMQSETSHVRYTAVNKAGTVTTTIAEDAGTIQTLSAGTLTTTWAMSAATPTVITVNADSSLTPSTGYPRITCEVFNGGQQAITFP